MQTYRFTGPDGKRYAFEGPKGLTSSDVELLKQGFFAPAPAPAEEPPPAQGEPGIWSSIMRGGRGIASLFGDVAPAMVAKGLGFEDYARRQLQEYSEYEKETQRLYPSAVPSFTDIKDVGSALTYVKEAIFEAIPSLLPMIFTGGTAGVLSKGAQLAAREAAERAAVSVATKELTEKAGQAALTAEALETVKKTALDAGLKAAQREALKYEAAGTLAGSAALNIPEVYQNLYEKGSGELPDLAPALVAGGFNAVLDSITPLNLLRTARAQGITNEALIGAWYKRAGKGAVQGFFTEGGTEAVQEMSSAAAERFVNENNAFFTPENFVRFIDAGLKGGFGGAGITAATNVAFGQKEETPPPPAPEAEQPPAAPKVDINSREFKKKQAQYEELLKGIQELEAKGDQLTSREKGTLTGRRNRAAKLRPEIEEALAQAGVSGEQGVAGSQPGTGGGGFEISEQPSDDAAVSAAGAGAAQSGGVDAAGQVSGTASVGAGKQPPAVAPRTVASFAAEIAAGKKLESPEDVQFYQNNAKEIEAELKRLAVKPSAAPPAPPAPTPAPPAPTPPAAPPVSVKPPAAPAPTPPAAPPVSAKPPVAPAPPAKPGSAQDIENRLNALLGSDEDDLPFSLGTARRTKEQIALDEAVDGFAAQVGLKRQAGESSKALGKRIRRALDLQKKIEAGTPLSEIPLKDVAQQELPDEKGYFPPQEQRDLYEETRQEFNAGIDEEIKRVYDRTYESEYQDAKEEGLSDDAARKRATALAEEASQGYHDDKLPAYKLLTDDERRVYFQNHIRKNNQLEHDYGASALSNYLSGKKQESRAGLESETVAREVYNQNRKASGGQTGIRYSFPAWNDLSPESRNLFLNINKNSSALELDTAFRAVKAQIQSEKRAEQNRENLVKAENEATIQMRNELRRALEKQPAGKGEKLPQEVVDALMRGDVKAALDYLKEHGQGLKTKVLRDRRGVPSFRVRDSVSRAVFRNLSSILSELPNFNVNIVYDENLGPEVYGQYDHKTNTIYFGKKGLDEATLLHELTHAATVKIINQYFTDKSKLTDRARIAVENISDVATLAKSRLGNTYPTAFEDLYEFVAYAMTDMDFQFALSRIQWGKAARATATTKEFTAEETKERELGQLVPPPFRVSAWNYFTDTIAWLYKLFTPKSSAKEIYRFVRYEDLAKPVTKKEKAKKSDKTVEELVGEAPDIERATEADLEAEAEAEAAAEAERQAAEVRQAVEADKNVVTVQRGLVYLRKSILREPGYRGNLLLEVSAAFEDIISAPEGGIERLAGREEVGTRLESKGSAAAPKTVQAPSGKTIDTLTPEEFEAEILRQLSIKERGTKAFLKGLATESGQDWAIRKFQNERNVIKKLFEQAQKLGLVKRTDEDLNDVWGQITRSTGMAADLYSRYIEPHKHAAEVALEKYAEKLGIPVKEALSRVHAILEARHEPERRHVKFLLSVPLDDSKKLTITGFNDKSGKPLALSADGWREHILEQLTRADLAPTDAQRGAMVKRYRALLEQLVADPRTHTAVVNGVDAKGRKTTRAVAPDEYSDSHENYNVIAARTPAQIQKMKDIFDTKEDAGEINAIVSALRKLQDETERLNKESNYWSTPVQNVVDFYGFTDYVPFKGKAGRTSLDDQLNYDSRRIGGELQEMQAPMGGRMSESENPMLQLIAEGAQAAMRAGRKDLTLAIKNAIKDKIVSGKVAGKILFSDRYLKGDTKEELGGPDKIFHYNADGTIDVLKIEDDAQLQAIRRSYREASPFWDMINMVTSGIGQTHTRFNPAFAPMNFVRDALTNAFTLGAELAPEVAGRLIKIVAAETASGGVFRAGKYANLYSAGKFDEIKRLAGGDAPYNTLTEKQRYYRDLDEYVKLGGKVSYLQGIAAKGALDSLVKEVGRSKLAGSADQITRIFDIYNEAFELAARVSAFRALRDEFRNSGETQVEATSRAVEYAKNLANFEQVGEWGKQAGALFMFFRPAATGAVRAIDALRPAFGFNEANFRAAAKAKGRTPEEINRAVAQMKTQQRNARVMAGSLLGLGVAVYYMALMMAGDDDQGRNRIVTDDMARWTRYARIFIPGMENPLQIPWGFGLGAFAAAGAQIAALVSGRAAFSDIAANIATIGLDSFVPLPFSRISPVENFPAFALDSITPSAARPFFEYVMNLDGLGREIYNNRQSRYGDAYTGGDNIPEVYKDIARTLFEATTGKADVSPNTLYFFANNFADGFAKIGTWMYNVGLSLSGQKDFDPKNDTLFLASYIGTKSNIDSREFNKAETYAKNLGTRINALKNQPGMLARYVQQHPEDIVLYQMYNQAVNGQLRDLRAAANQIRASDMSPKERKAQLDMIVNMQNVVKRQILDSFKIATGYEP